MEVHYMAHQRRMATSGDRPALRKHLQASLSAQEPFMRMLDLMEVNSLDRQHQGAVAKPFPLEEVFHQALSVFNKRGERFANARAVQDWFFAEMRTLSGVRASRASCSRCGRPLTRRAPRYFRDQAKAWPQADDLCRFCMLALIRQNLGEDDDSILEEARALAGSGWAPIIDPHLAEMLLGRDRTFFNS